MIGGWVLALALGLTLALALYGNEIVFDSSYINRYK